MKKTRGRTVQRMRSWTRPYLIRLERRQRLPPKPRQLLCVKFFCAHNSVAEDIVSTLRRRIVGIPVVRHDPGENSTAQRMEIRRPRSANDVSEGDDGRIQRNHRGCGAIAGHRRPVIHGIPFTAAAYELIARRIYPSVLRFIAELRMVPCK